MSRVLVFPKPAPVPQRYASAPESARLLKAALRRAFPAVVFSVRLSRGTGYGDCHVSWTDGPTSKLVEAVVAPFEGESFDGMVDMRESVPAFLPDGRRSGLRLISCDRHISATLARKAAAQVAAFYGLPEPTINEREGSRYWTVEPDRCPRPDIGEPWSTLVYRAASDRSQFARD